jgi:hypothetical protein
MEVEYMVCRGEIKNGPFLHCPMSNYLIHSIVIEWHRSNVGWNVRRKSWLVAKNYGYYFILSI